MKYKNKINLQFKNIIINNLVNLANPMLYIICLIM